MAYIYTKMCFFIDIRFTCNFMNFFHSNIDASTACLKHPFLNRVILESHIAQIISKEGNVTALLNNYKLCAHNRLLLDTKTEITLKRSF